MAHMTRFADHNRGSTDISNLLFNIFLLSGSIFLKDIFGNIGVLKPMSRFCMDSLQTLHHYLDTLADFKYGVNTDVNIGVSVTRGGNTLFEVMGIC